MTVDPPGSERSTQTVRERIAEALRAGPLTLRELSQTVRVSEKDLPGHLTHLQRSARQRGEQLRIEPASCLACGFVFADRQRMTKPSTCPACKSGRIEHPRFVLITARRG